MKCKRILSALAVCILTGTAWAADNYLKIQTSSGWKVINLDEVKRLTFAEGNMVVTDVNEQPVLTVPQSDMQTLSVGDMSGVEKTNVAANGSAIKVYDKVITTYIDGDFALYNIKGELLVEIPSLLAGQTVDLSELEDGIMIVKLGEKTQKIVLK